MSIIVLLGDKGDTGYIGDGTILKFVNGSSCKDKELRLITKTHKSRYGGTHTLSSEEVEMGRSLKSLVH